MVKRTLIISLVFSLLIGILGRDLDLYLGAFNLTEHYNINDKLAREVFFDTSDHGDFDFSSHEINHWEKISGDHSQQTSYPDYLETQLQKYFAYSHWSTFIVFEADSSPPLV